MFLRWYCARIIWFFISPRDSRCREYYCVVVMFQSTLLHDEKGWRIIIIDLKLSAMAMQIIGSCCCSCLSWMLDVTIPQKMFLSLSSTFFSKKWRAHSCDAHKAMRRRTSPFHCCWSGGSSHLSLSLSLWARYFHFGAASRSKHKAWVMVTPLVDPRERIIINFVYERRALCLCASLQRFMENLVKHSKREFVVEVDKR